MNAMKRRAVEGARGPTFGSTSTRFSQSATQCRDKGQVSHLGWRRVQTNAPTSISAWFRYEQSLGWWSESPLSLSFWFLHWLLATFLPKRAASVTSSPDSSLKLLFVFFVADFFQ